MGTMTISIDDEVEREFRTTVGGIKGHYKGALGDALNEVITKWIEAVKQENARKQALEQLHKGFDMGKINYSKREELYER